MDDGRAAVSREVRRLAATIHGKLPRQGVRLRKGQVVGVNSDGTVDIILPFADGPHSYPRMRTLGSYTTPLIDDVVWFADMGHGRYLCYGTEIGPQTAPTASPPRTFLESFQIILPLPHPTTGDKTPPWYPELGKDVSLKNARVSVTELSSGPLYLVCYINDVHVSDINLPAGQMTIPAPFAYDVFNGQSVGFGVFYAAGDVPAASVILDAVPYTGS